MANLFLGFTPKWIIITTIVVGSAAIAIPAKSQGLSQSGRLTQIANQATLRAIGVDAAVDTARSQDTLRGIVVAILSTGVDTSLPELKGRIVNGVSFAAGEQDVFDYHGLGTHLATLIAAIAPNASFEIVKILPSSGRSTPSSIGDGLRYAIESRPDIILFAAAAPRDIDILRSTSGQASKAGITFIAAAGDNGTSDPSYPAGYPSVLGVGCLSDQSDKERLTGHGDWVSLYIPCDEIRAIFGRELTPVYSTHVAAAVTAGVAALVLGVNSALGSEETKSILIRTSSRFRNREPILGQNVRVLDALNAVNAAFVKR